MCVRCQAGAFLATIEHKYQCAMCHKLTAFDFTPTHPTEEAADQLEVALIPSDKLMYTHMHTHTLTHTHTHTQQTHTNTRCYFPLPAQALSSLLLLVFHWQPVLHTHTHTHTDTHTPQQLFAAA
jgi:hypothetical protein